MRHELGAREYKLVLLRIAPGVEFQYEYNIPAYHPAGTYWYPPHLHGSTALQVSSLLGTEVDPSPLSQPNLSLAAQLSPDLPADGSYPDSRPGAVCIRSNCAREYIQLDLQGLSAEHSGMTLPLVPTIRVLAAPQEVSL